MNSEIGEAFRKSGLAITVEEYFAEQIQVGELYARIRINVEQFIRDRKLANQATAIARKTVIHKKH